jgi:type III pantothenate kinase
MLLVIDIGNTNTVMGVYQGHRLIKDWRLRTERNTTEDEFNVIVSSLFAQAGIPPEKIEKTIISSVVPPMVTILDSFCRKYLGYPPLWVDATSYKKMPILYRNPGDVGADRIVNAVAAYHKYRYLTVFPQKGNTLAVPSVPAL